MRVIMICFLSLLSCFVKDSLSCSCFPLHLQTDICQADFAIKATILSVEDYDNLTLRYNVSVEKNFKTGQQTPNSVISVFTADNSATCGVNFEVGETYLIVGTLMGEYRTNLCRWNRKFSTLSEFQLFALNTTLYMNNCECKIYQCFNEECESQADCLVDQNSAGCYDVNEACTKRGPNCSWLNNTC